MKPVLHQPIPLLFAMLMVSVVCTVYGEPKQVKPGAADHAVIQQGATIYRRQCAECHGEKGEGVEGFYEKALAGNRSLDWLTRRIERTMPEGEADKCVGDNAKAVAAYLHEQFYKPSQQSGQTLQRLIVEQHRQTLADLVGSFRDEVKVPYKRGLLAQYYPGRDMKKAKPITQIVEPQLDIAFNDQHPLHKHFEPNGHSVRWSGSLIVDETGSYEIVVNTDHAMRLWLNDGKAQGGGISNEITDTSGVTFLDGWLQSKDKTQWRKKIFLLAGRAYPLMLEFSSHNQGVGNKQWQEKHKGKQSSYISLKWVKPGGVEETIPSRHLVPQRFPEVFVMSAPFPADDASTGFINGAQVSDAWLSASTNAAIQTADYVTNHLDELAGTQPKASDRRERAIAFSRTFVERAFRRPITDEEAKRYIDVHFEQSLDTKTAAKRAVLMALISPHFLYPKAEDRQDDFATASRLALAMWDGLPDKALRQAAAQGELSTPNQIKAHAKRMLEDPRAKAKLMRFFHHWLELERAEDLSKDKKLFPEFDDQLMADLSTSLHLFLEHVVFSERSDYRELLLADYLYVNERLAAVYGIESGEVSDHAFTAAKVPTDRRSGLITHPYLLTAFAYHNSTSPIHRGVFLTRNIIGRPLNPPPNAIAFTDAEFDPNLTMREKVTAFTRDSACMACHETINPLGFSLEHYDGIGRWRTTEKGKPINAESPFIGDEGETVKLKGARDVAEFAVASNDAHQAFVRLLYQHMLQRDPSAVSSKTLSNLTTAFKASDFHIRNLYMQIALSEATQGLKSDTQANATLKPKQEARP